ncbi:MAG: prepilin-type N-terminal cleavage/methylation domain-containing protein [Verrucomicrobiae bacterium]|nr:prepilin-type N-terminal cleavage/methylation domain-containing protein [Verrucomicrobiae bacterium]
MSPRSAQAGFSLVEVMISILILGVALTGLTTGIATALRSARESELRTAAALVAAGVIETLRAEGYLIAGSTEGPCGDALPAARWYQTLAAGDLDGLYRVQVAIRHEETGRTLFELETLLFDPPFATANTESDSRDRRRDRDRRSQRP